MGAVGKTSTITTTQETRHDADGTSWKEVVAHGALTAKTTYAIFPGQTGYVSAAFTAANAQHCYIGVAPAGGVASGATAWLQIGGPCLDMVTASITSVVGEALEMHDGAVALAGGAAWSGTDAAFAIATEASAASAHDVFLCGEKILTST